AWSRRRSGFAGLFIGIGAALKLYPVLLLGPLLLVALRSSRRGRDLRRFAAALGTAAVTWAAVNLPVYLLAPDGWRAFFTFNADRGADLGSPWYAINLRWPAVLPDRIDPLVVAAGAVALVLIVVLALAAPEPPRLAQLAFLAVAAFVLIN